MQLLYLWIDDFRNIRKQGFKFNSEFYFTIAAHSNIKNKYELTIDFNDRDVKLFPENILSVTGIVGKNGSGKSTLLHCIKMMCGQLAHLTTALIFVILDDPNKKIYTYYYKEGGTENMRPLSVVVKATSKLKDKYKVLNAKAYQIKRFLDTPEDISGIDFDFRNTIACCYFSNAFDSHREDIYRSIINLSTNYRIESFLKKYIEKKITEGAAPNREPKYSDIFPSHIVEFHKLETKTLLKFISYAKGRKTDDLPTIPDKITIRFNFSDYEYLQNVYSQTSILFDKKAMERIQAEAVKILRSTNNKKAAFSNLVVLCSFYYALRWDLFKPNNVSMHNVRASIDKIANDPSDLFQKIKSFLKPLKIIDDIDSKTRTLNEFLGPNFRRLLEKVTFIQDANNTGDKSRFVVQADMGLWEILNLITDLKYTVESSFLDYSWSGISTGEEAFFLHFGKLNEIKKDIHGRDLWLLIDEGDLYFHPQWQKEYFNTLLTYVQFLFPRNKVQIVLTTHSPFIVSDLPKENLLFLKRGMEGNCIVEDARKQSDTFGANIHELFTGSFFLENGLIGEFAKSKINEAIKWCMNKENINNADHYRSLIGIIGDPIIKTKLAEMFALKLGENLELARLRAQQEYISKRIKEIDNDSN